jgi:lipopolysaccharide transport system permease protein
MANLSATWRYCQSVWHYRHFWMSLVRLDLQAKYRRSVLGVGWTLLHPLAMTAVLCVVFHGIFGRDIVSYAPLVLTGLALWNFLTSVTLEGCGCLYAGEKYIRSTSIPMAIYPLRTLLSVATHFLIILSVTVLFTLVTRGSSNPAALLALAPALALLFILGWSIAVVFGFANVYFPDTHHIAQIGFQVLFYLTPIIYAVEDVRSVWLRFILEHNPLGTLVTLFRAPILDAAVPSAALFARACVMVAVAATVAVVMLHRFERRLIFEL